MPKAHSPRKGSLQYWPRVRAKRPYARIRNPVLGKDAVPLSFAGYKVGMTQVVIADNRAHSLTKGEEILFPVTILECPPMKVASIRAYAQGPEGMRLVSEVLAPVDKTLARRLTPAKKEHTLDAMEKQLDSIVQIRINAYTQPAQAGVSKKTPEIFEVAIGGSVADQFAYAKGVLGKEFSVADVIKEGQQIDAFAVTKGKGFQGPVKRHGVTIRQHKSEKTIRGPANVGAWTGNRSWTVAHAGQMGFHQRLERNKWVLKIGQKPEEVGIRGGFLRYGLPKATYVIVKGSLQGPRKRLIRFVPSVKPNKLVPQQAPSIEAILTDSLQGN